MHKFTFFESICSSHMKKYISAKVLSRHYFNVNICLFVCFVCVCVCVGVGVCVGVCWGLVCVYVWGWGYVCGLWGVWRGGVGMGVGVYIGVCLFVCFVVVVVFSRRF